MPLFALNPLDLRALLLRDAKAGYADTLSGCAIDNVVQWGWLRHATFSAELREYVGDILGAWSQSRRQPGRAKASYQRE
jgi:hypothetical protein